jgi:hypothetical protein
MSVRFIPHIERPRRLSVFGENMLQGGYLDVYRGSTYRNGWNSKMVSFMTSKSQNKLKIMGKHYEI